MGDIVKFNSNSLSEVSSFDILKLLQGYECLQPLFDVESDGVKDLPQLKTEGFNPTSEHRNLRLRFWEEINRTLANNFHGIDIKSIYMGVCSGTRFLETLENEQFCHYLLNRVKDYRLNCGTLADEHSENVYLEILNTRPVEKVYDKETGEYLEREVSFKNKLLLMSRKLDALKRLEDTAGVGPIQRSESRVSSITASTIIHQRSTTVGGGNKDIRSMNLEELQSRLKELEESISLQKSSIKNDVINTEFTECSDDPNTDSSEKKSDKGFMDRFKKKKK